MKRALLSLIALAVVALVLTRCGKETPKPGTFGAVFKSVDTSNCKRCHAPGGTGPAAGSTLNFTAQDVAYTTLTGGNKVQGTAGQPGCGNVFLVKAGAPTSSYLMGILFSSYNTNNFGGQTGCTPLTDHQSYHNLTNDEIQSMKDWITNGAKND